MMKGPSYLGSLKWLSPSGFSSFMVFRTPEEIPSYPKSHHMGSIYRFYWVDGSGRGASVCSPWFHETPTGIHLWALKKEKKLASLAFSWPLLSAPCSLFLFCPMEIGLKCQRIMTFSRGHNLEVIWNSCHHIYLLHIHSTYLTAQEIQVASENTSGVK